MSILSELFGSLFGDGEQQSSAVPLATHPCSNCPSDCAIAGEACEICAPYKKRLIDAIYYVDHLDEFRAQYEVTGLGGTTGAITCPFCGAPTENHYVCEYCGSKLAEDSGKIKVESASDIPNPIMQAQDIIFERYEAVIKQYSKKASGLNLVDDDGIFGELISLFTGDKSSDTSESKLGAKMSEAEIKEAAALYNTSVSDYLTGLDNGKYLTLAGRKAVQTYTGTTNYSTYTPAGAGVPGIAGIELLTGLLLSGRFHKHTPVRPAPRPPQGARRPDPFDTHHKPYGGQHQTYSGSQRKDVFAAPKKPAQPKAPAVSGIPKSPVNTGIPKTPVSTGTPKRPASQGQRRQNSSSWGLNGAKTGWGTIKRNSGRKSSGGPGPSGGPGHSGGPGSGPNGRH